MSNDASRRSTGTGRILVGIATFLITSFWLFFAAHSNKVGWDFPVFYITAALPQDEIYSRAAFAECWQQHLAPLGVIHWGRFVRLPVFGAMLGPIALVNYRQALLTWMAAGLGAYVIALGTIMRRLQLPDLFLPFSAAFFPAVFGWISGQDNCLVLVCVVVAWMCLLEERDLTAGLVFALALYKYNVVVLIPLFLVLQKRYRALAAFAAGAATIIALSFAITPLSTYMETLAEVRSETPDFWPIGLRGFAYSIGHARLYPWLAFAVAVLCCWLMRRLPTTEALAVAVTGSLMIVPYVCWYDCTLLLFPLAVIYSRSGGFIRIGCLLVLAAVPAWAYSGRNNGLAGLIDVTVEMLALARLARMNRSSAARREPVLSD
jgi:hypothetical protein